MRFRPKQSGGDGHCRLFYASDIASELFPTAMRKSVRSWQLVQG